MFDSLIAWLESLWQTVSAFFNAIWILVQKFMVSIWGMIVIAFGFLWSVATVVGAAFHTVVALLSTLPIPGFTGMTSIPDGITGSLAFLNSFVPVNESFAFVIAYISLIAALQTIKFIKWVKSWIWAS